MVFTSINLSRVKTEFEENQIKVNHIEEKIKRLGYQVLLVKVSK